MHRQSSINRSAFNDSEARSLRRSFSSIHQYSSHRTSPTSPLDNDDDMDNNCNNPKKKESLRRKSHHHHGNGNGPSRRISMDTTSGDEKQLSSAALPYANNNKAERHTRHSHPTSNNNKTKPHNRRASYTGITAQTAQEMVAEMLNDKNTTSSSNNAHHHQQHSSSRCHTTTATRQQQQKAPPRRVTVSFGPTTDQLQQLRNSTQTQYEMNYNNSMPDIHNNNNHSQQQSSHTHNNPPQRQHMGYRPDYKLGQVARSPSHLLIPPTSTSTTNNNKSKLNYINQIATLLKHDFAFVKRSNGLYSYAILAYRTNPGCRINPSKSTHGGMVNNGDDYYDGEYKEEGMAFVMDNVGSTKMIRRKHWFEYIRLVSMDDLSYDNDSGMEIEDYGMEEGLINQRTPSHPDVTLSYQQFKSRTTRRPEDLQENVPQDMLCQEIPQVCQEVDPQVNQEQEEEMFEFEDDEPLPGLISFKPTNVNEEECSLISSVSDRARRANSRVWR